MKKFNYEEFMFNFSKNLKKQLKNHRKDILHLSQEKVAELLYKSEKTYQRWESTGQLSNIYDILNALQVLQFSTAEIIKLFELPPLTLDELKEVNMIDGEGLKNLKEDALCSYMRNYCENMNELYIEKLICILIEERLKRHENRHSS